MGNGLKYRIEKVVTRPGMLMLSLAAACLILAVIITALALLFVPAGEVGGQVQAAWRSLLTILDPGALAEDQYARVGWPYRALMLLATIGGILLISSLIAVLSTALNRKVDEMKTGRTPVVERNHTVVLGWSSQIQTMLDELTLAGDGHPVVILSDDLSKQEMDDIVKSRSRPRGGRPVKVICRHGDPTNVEDLALVALERASAVIVPRPIGKDPDVRVLMTLLALNCLGWAAKEHRPVAAVVSSGVNVDAAELALREWPTRLRHVIDAEDMTARLIVQSRRFPGLSVALGELLSFVGVEVRVPHARNRAAAFQTRGELTFGQAALRYGSASLIGFRRGETLYVNPPATEPILPGDVPILIAKGSGADEVRFLRSPVLPQAEQIVRDYGVARPQVEKTLILGWNRRIVKIIDVLDGYVAAGSEVFVVGDGFDPGALPTTTNVKVDGLRADPTEPGVLIAADEAKAVAPGRVIDDVRTSINPNEYQSVIVLTDDDSGSHADARALATLLLLRAIKNRLGGRFAMLCELDIEANRRLAHSVEADDLVVGQHVVSTLAVQYAKNPGRSEVNQVIAEWLDARDSDLYFEPAASYVRQGVSVTWATVVKAASDRSETAIGYVVAGNYAAGRDRRVHLNPHKTSARRYEDGDRVIVIAHAEQRMRERQPAAEATA